MHDMLNHIFNRLIYKMAQNPHHPSLRLHPLKDKLAALHSVSINLRYRITLEMIITEKVIILVNVGSHDEVCQG